MTVYIYDKECFSFPIPKDVGRVFGSTKCGLDQQYLISMIKKKQTEREIGGIGEVL